MRSGSLIRCAQGSDGIATLHALSITLQLTTTEQRPDPFPSAIHVRCRFPLAINQTDSNRTRFSCVSVEISKVSSAADGRGSVCGKRREARGDGSSGVLCDKGILLDLLQLDLTRCALGRSH